MQLGTYRSGLLSCVSPLYQPGDLVQKTSRAFVRAQNRLLLPVRHRGRVHRQHQTLQLRT